MPGAQPQLWEDDARAVTEARLRKEGGGEKTDAARAFDTAVRREPLGCLLDVRPNGSIE